MKKLFLLYTLCVSIVMVSCTDVGSGGEFSGEGANNLETPFLSRMNIYNPVKSYKHVFDEYGFLIKKDESGQNRLQGISYKSSFDKNGTVKLKHNPLEYRHSYRDGLDIYNAYFSGFVFKYSGGPVVRMEFKGVWSANNKIDKTGTISFTYDTDDYLQEIEEIYDDGNTFRTVMEWESAKYTSGKHLKSISAYKNEKIFDMNVFYYYSRTRINKEGVTPELLMPSISSHYYPIFAFFGFYGRPSSELPTSCDSGTGDDPCSVIFHFYEDDNKNLTRLKSKWDFGDSTYDDEELYSY